MAAGADGSEHMPPLDNDETLFGERGAEGLASAFKNADNLTVTLFIGGMIAVVILGGVLYKTFVGGDSNTAVVEEGLSWTDDKSSEFVAPAARQEFITVKAASSQSDPEAVRKLKQLLMKRTFAAIPFLLELQTQGPSADRLYKKGMITDTMHVRYKNMKNFFDVEFPEVQAEAEQLVQGWGAQIWQQANQIYQSKKAQSEKEAAAANPLLEEDESFIKAVPLSDEQKAHIAQQQAMMRQQQQQQAMAQRQAQAQAQKN